MLSLEGNNKREISNKDRRVSDLWTPSLQSLGINIKGIFKREQIKIIVQNGKLKYPEQPLSDKSCFSTAICPE